MALTDREIRKIEPGTALAKLSDGGGLQLWVTPDGAKRWRLAYRYNGKQKTLAIGVYPMISLRDARDARDDARRLLGSEKTPRWSESWTRLRKSRLRQTPSIRWPMNSLKRSVSKGRQSAPSTRLNGS
jgi:hypothetical protein